LSCRAGFRFVAAWPKDAVSDVSDRVYNPRPARLRCRREPPKRPLQPKPVSLETWRAPTGRHLAFLGFAGLFVTIGHVGFLLAYRLGQTAAVTPFFYSFALWAVLSGLLVFGALPNAVALAGIALVVASGVAIVLIDQRPAGRARDAT
jgi:hypothetical protein